MVTANGQNYEQMGALEVTTFQRGHSEMKGFRRTASDEVGYRDYVAKLESKIGPAEAERVLREFAVAHGQPPYRAAQVVPRLWNRPVASFDAITELPAAFRALLAAREKRGTLDLELPERRVLLDEAGRVADVVPRARLDSHRLIEEFMVAANVCAAEGAER